MVNTVAVVEDVNWIPGLEFLVALRRRGTRVVRLLGPGGSDPSMARLRRATAPMLDRIVLNAVDRDGRLTEAGIRALQEERPSDIQCVERLLPSVFGVPGVGEFARPPVTAMSLDAVVDKGVLTSFLADRGIGVPRTWPDIASVPDSEPGPFMLKPRTAGGGRGVVRVETLPELRSSRLGLDGIVQRCHEDVRDSAGVAKDGRVLAMATYRNAIAPHDPYGRALAIAATRDPGMEELTEQVVAALGVHGPFAIDAVTGPGGEPLLIDLNLRVFGCWAAMQQGGVDVLGAYEHAVLGRQQRRSYGSLAARREELLVVPPEGDLPAGTRARGSWLASASVLAGRRARFLGARWWLLTQGRAVKWTINGT